MAGIFEIQTFFGNIAFPLASVLAVKSCRLTALMGRAVIWLTIRVVDNCSYWLARYLQLPVIAYGNF